VEEEPELAISDALLIAGYRGGAAGAAGADPCGAALAALGEVLLSSGQRWRIRRLAPHATERDLPSRVSIRREIGALMARPSAARLIVIVGEIARTLDGPGLVCAREPAVLGDDRAVALAWIGDRLELSARIPTVAVLIGDGDRGPPARWAECLARGGAAHLVAAWSGRGPRELRGLTEALARTGVDPAAGAVTLRSLGGALQAHDPAIAIQPAAASAAILVPATLAALDAPALVARAPSAPDPEDLVGQMLPGRFRVLAPLGAGGAGRIYRAHQELVDRQVAIKLLPAGVPASAATRFLEEIQILGRLDHPHIVRVLAADVTPGGRLFIAMELIDGVSLEELLARAARDPGARLDRERALALGHQLLAALGAAHARGVIHADVSPANVMVTDAGRGRAVLIDFGMAHVATGAARARGGTLGYLAPEQREGGVVTAASDVYAAALVIAALLAPSAPAAPAADARVAAVDDPGLRAALARATAADPAARLATIEELADAIAAGAGAAARSQLRAPFLRAAPFDEACGGELRGRDREVATLVEHALFRRLVVYAAPSGTGKTSLLRAGLVPRLRELGVEAVYFAYRAGLADSLAAQVAPGAASLAAAIASQQQRTRRRLVLILDQVEAALAPGGAGLREELALDAWPADADVALVLSVREEHLAHLLERVQPVEPGAPVLRLGPLPLEGARAALVEPLARRGIGVEPQLLDALLGDLAAAAAALAGELGWGAHPAVYPPHLQLAGAVLYDARAADCTTLDLALYQRLGGLASIMSEHLHRVLEGELAPAELAIARGILLAFAATPTARTACAEGELVAIGQRAPLRREGAHEPSPTAVRGVIAFLRDRGLIVPIAGRAGEIYWDLAHDSLVDAIRAWVTTSDLARLRALEIVRYHLRRWQPGTMSLLATAELREVRACLAERDLDDLDAEWARPALPAQPAHALLAASRSAIRMRSLALASLAGALLVVAAVFAIRWRAEHELNERRDRDLGEVVLVLAPFDWDPAALVARDDPDAAAGLSWELRRPRADDPDAPGEPFAAGDLFARALPATRGAPTYRVQARGGLAVLVVARAQPLEAPPCRDVWLPVRMPGYRSPGAAPAVAMQLRVPVPSCAATRAGMIEIPAGPYVAGGRGDPAGEVPPDELTPEDPARHVARYWIDRTEVPNALFGRFDELRAWHGIAQPPWPDTESYTGVGGAEFPALGITWREARALCRFLGKDLPTLDEWDKALRGGLVVGGRPNPCPRRTFAQCGELDRSRPNVRAGRVPRPAPVASHAHDVSPYGVLGLVGGAQEWTRSFAAPRAAPPAARRRHHARPGPWVITRGCNWADIECSTPRDALTMMPIENPRLADTRYFGLGFRCAMSAR
jgi:formylglycine-generating enzyme required for sulfatase activity